MRVVFVPFKATTNEHSLIFNRASDWYLLITDMVAIANMWVGMTETDESTFVNIEWEKLFLDQASTDFSEVSLAVTNNSQIYWLLVRNTWSHLQRETQ